MFGYSPPSSDGLKCCSGFDRPAPQSRLWQMTLPIPAVHASVRTRRPVAAMPVGISLRAPATTRSAFNTCDPQRLQVSSFRIGTRQVVVPFFVACSQTSSLALLLRGMLARTPTAGRALGYLPPNANRFSLPVFRLGQLARRLDRTRIFVRAISA